MRKIRSSIESYHLRKHKKDHCELCGVKDYENSVRGLHVHHVNDPEDHSSNNLQTLCPSCHLKLHHKQWQRFGEKNPASKLTDSDREKIIREYSLGEIRYVDLAEKYGVSKSTIGDVINKHSVNPEEIETWLDRTRQLESGGDDYAIGDKGRSRGAYQIQRRIWNAFRPDSSWIWSTDAHDPTRARATARAILCACKRKCIRDKKEVTFENVRYYYTHGGF